MLNLLLKIAVLGLFVLVTASPASAIPILQLYIEGAEYDSGSESWVYQDDGSTPLRLWTIGNVSGPGGKGTILDVMLAVAYDEAFSGITVDLAPTVAGGTGSFMGVDDPSTPGAPTQTLFGGQAEVQDGSVPKLGDGRDLPTHGEYGDGTYWQQFELGDFDGEDSHIGDFIDDFPTVLYADAGQISAYEVSVSAAGGMSLDGLSLHFDLYDHVMAGNRAKSKFAPFSHDADGVPSVPEPASLLLVGVGLGALGTASWRRRRRN